MVSFHLFGQVSKHTGRYQLPCTLEDTLAHILGAPYFDDVMSNAIIACFPRNISLSLGGGKSPQNGPLSLKAPQKKKTKTTTMGAQ